MKKSSFYRILRIGSHRLLIGVDKHLGVFIYDESIQSQGSAGILIYFARSGLKRLKTFKTICQTSFNDYFPKNISASTTLINERISNIVEYYTNNHLNITSSITDLNSYQDTQYKLRPTFSELRQRSREDYERMKITGINPLLVSRVESWENCTDLVNLIRMCKEITRTEAATLAAHFAGSVSMLSRINEDTVKAIKCWLSDPSDTARDLVIQSQKRIKQFCSSPYMQAGFHNAVDAAISAASTVTSENYIDALIGAAQNSNRATFSVTPTANFNGADIRKLNCNFLRRTIRNRTS